MVFELKRAVWLRVLGTGIGERSNLYSLVWKYRSLLRYIRRGYSVEPQMPRYCRVYGSADPLRARSSRIEKPRRPMKTRKDLPAWFWRFGAIEFTKNREICSFDYDEDLSEIEDSGDSDHCSDANSCHCEPWCECKSECGCEFQDAVDMESERSYDGEDAEYYYELKEEHEERKREKLEERKERDAEREFQRAKEDEFDAAYKSLETAEQEGKTTPVESLHRQSFQLFRSDAVDYPYHDLAPTMRVDFDAYDPSDPWCDDPDYHKRSSEPHEIREAGVRNDEAGIMHGFIYLNSYTDCHFGPFRPPKDARSREAITLSSDDGDELSLEFIGDGFLGLTLPREMVFTCMHMDRHSNDRRPHFPPPIAPDVFEFIGVLRDLEKGEAERKERLARRSPSPRETWFEMNYPMGWYKSGYM